MPSGLPNSNRVAIVGASSLRGKELKLVLEERNFPADEIILLDVSVMAGTLTEAGGEPTFIRELEADSFEKVRFAFFAGSTLDIERNWQAAQAAGATVIDLTGVLAANGESDLVDTVARFFDSTKARAGRKRFCAQTCIRVACLSSCNFLHAGRGTRNSCAQDDRRHAFPAGF